MYFYGLDAFRAIAAILVIFGHVELIKSAQNLPNMFSELPFFMAQGDLAVTFFFVLSGFLITYLLLIEKEKYGSVSLKIFYLRRIFRIWPLYFLITFIGFYYLYFTVGFTSTDFKSLYYHLAVLSNIAPRSNPLAFQSWSIGVEEQFYILWPWIFFLPNKKSIYPIITIIIGLYLAKFFPVILSKLEIGPDVLRLKKFFDSARFDNMAMGGGLAYLMHYRLIRISPKFAKYIFIFTVIILSLQINIKYGLHNLIYSFIFALNIYFIVLTNDKKSILESGFIKYLGKISYGIYMWHVFAILIVINVTKNYLNFSLFSNNLILHILCVFLTIVISAASYEIFEDKFLKMKSKLSRLETMV